MTYENTKFDKKLSFSIHKVAAFKSFILTLFLILAIYIGSDKFKNFDMALLSYAFGCVFSFFGVCYRYFVWLSKPATEKYWKQSVQIFFNLRLWLNLSIPKIIISDFISKIVLQKFIMARSKKRWFAHFMIAWGCILAAMITFPLVFGWIHFAQGQISPDPSLVTYLFWFPILQFKLNSIISWVIFHVLVISAFMVLTGVFISLYRRMAEGGTKSVQRFGRDLLPLILLFLVSFSGLLLWISYSWLEGIFYHSIAQFHAVTVIATLIFLPFGKFFHIFQRLASIGVFIYKSEYLKKEQAKCPVTKENFTSKKHTEDLKEILHKMNFNYESSSGKGKEWNEISPKGRRILIGKAHSKIKNNKF